MYVDYLETLSCMHRVCVAGACASAQKENIMLRSCLRTQSCKLRWSRNYLGYLKANWNWWLHACPPIFQQKNGHRFLDLLDPYRSNPGVGGSTPNQSQLANKICISQSWWIQSNLTNPKKYIQTQKTSGFTNLVSAHRLAACSHFSGAQHAFIPELSLLTSFLVALHHLSLLAYVFKLLTDNRVICLAR